MVRKQVKALTVLYLAPCQHFGVYFAPYQILLVMGTGIGGCMGDVCKQDPGIS